MPELPDVEHFKRYFESRALNKKIDEVTVHDKKVLGTSSSKLRSALRGRRFKSLGRHGKHLVARLDDDTIVDLHFGMTGQLVYYDEGKEDPPRHDRVDVRFDDGHHLAYDCQRKLGRIYLWIDEQTLREQHELGPDAMDISREDFVEALSKRRGKVKDALMDQSLLAGLGNVYADEVLFQHGINPEAKCGDLSRNELGKLHTTMQRVLRTALRHDGDASELPKKWLIHHREGGDECPRCGGRIKQGKVGGRTTYYCGKHQ
jgi:formamidopyrimidine-DNA glycosylase